SLYSPPLSVIYTLSLHDALPISLILLFYVTSIAFVVVVLGGFLGAYVRLNIFRLFRYLREEFFLVLGTSTAEPALPGLMRKLSRSEEHTSELQSRENLVCRLLLE